MLSELHQLPAVYSTTPDNSVAMARMSPDAQKLALWVVTEDESAFKGEFGESELLLIKETAGKEIASSWGRFFEELQCSFNAGRVSINDKLLLECVFSNELKVAFPLEGSTEDGHTSVLEALLSYHFIHVHSKDIEKQLESSKKKEMETSEAVVSLEREAQSLKEIISRNLEQDNKNRARLGELLREVSEAEAHRKGGGNGGESGEENDDEEHLICRVRNPLGKLRRKNVDIELLRLVKGKWLFVPTEQQDESPEWGQPYNTVVRPFTSTDFIAFTSSFTTAQQEVVWNCMQKIDAWDYDVFQLQSILSGDDWASLAHQEKGGSLFYTFYALLLRQGVMQYFNLDESVVLNLISVIEAGYHANPYHNSMHAADVLHITHYILEEGGLMKKCRLSMGDIFAALFAAAIHDYDHPGINNSFHVKAQTYLAMLYNDKSPLENRHVSSIFELMKLPHFNILAGLSEELRRDIRDTMIEMILATDMGLHGKYYQQFKRRLAENKELHSKKEDQRLALAMALKMADISNCGRPTELYLRWSAKLSDEFYMQGDKERNLGMPCSPFMDRNLPAIAKGQISFMNYIVIPLFESIAELLPNMQFSVDMTELNKHHWTKNMDE